MDDLARHAAKVLGVADHAIVEARTDGNQHIAMLHGHVGFVGTVHTQHTDKTLA